MGNIVWGRPDGGVSITNYPDEKIDALEYAAELQKRGDIPGDWTNMGVDLPAADLPEDRVFRAAWRNTGSVMPVITEDIVKSKEIAHEARRRLRQASLSPLDDIISKQIPGQDLTEIEAKRQKIRNDNAVIQNKIDAAKGTKTLRAILTDHGIK